MALALSYVNTYSSTSGLTTYTFAASSLGTAASDRYIIVSIGSRKTTTGTTISTVSVAGVGATIVKQDLNGGTGTGNIAGIAIAAVPAGTTGDIVVTFAAAQLRCEIGVYAATGIDPAAIASASSVATPPAATLTTAAGGAAVGIVANTAATSAITWSGLTSDFDNSLAATMHVSGASVSSLGAGTISISATVAGAAYSSQIGVFASFQAASVGGFTAVFRNTLSQIGGRVGSRQAT